MESGHDPSKNRFQNYSLIIFDQLLKYKSIVDCPDEEYARIRHEVNEEIKKLNCKTHFSFTIENDPRFDDEFNMRLLTPKIDIDRIIAKELDDTELNKIFVDIGDDYEMLKDMYDSRFKQRLQ